MVTGTVTTTVGGFPGTEAHQGGALLPDGRVFCTPSNTTTARIYNPVTNTVATPATTFPGSNPRFAGSVALFDGRIFCVPRNGTAGRVYGAIGKGYAPDVLLSAYYNNY